jgi:hypothetical protein
MCWRTEQVTVNCQWVLNELADNPLFLKFKLPVPVSRLTPEARATYVSSYQSGVIVGANNAPNYYGSHVHKLKSTAHHVPSIQAVQ